MYSHAQHPAYYHFAQDEFASIDIYDVIQDNALNYWFATDQGLMIHDGYTYNKVSCDEMKGASVFGFVKDSKGTVYCYNLHHQIFRLRKGLMELYFEIPEDMTRHEISLFVDHADNLLIQSRGLIRISENKTSVDFLDDDLFGDSKSPLNFHLLPDGSTISVSTEFDIAHQKNGAITYYSCEDDKTPIPQELRSAFTWVTINDHVYAIERSKMLAYEFDVDEFKFTYVKQLNLAYAGQTHRAYTTDNQLWITGISNGALIYDEFLNPLYGDHIMYPSTFISDVFTDHENNILLSSFDIGILVISNPDVLGYSLANDEKIVHITSDDSGNLFFGSNLGNIFHHENGRSRLIYSDPSKKSNEGVYYWTDQDILIFYTSKGARLSKWDGNSMTHLADVSGAFKNVDFSYDSKALLAFNHGIVEVSVENGKLISNPINSLQKRAYCVVRDQKSGSIYAGISNGLVRLDTDGKSELLHYNGQVIYPNAIVYNKGKVFVGTRKHGVLIYEADAVVQNIPFEGRIRKLAIDKNRLFILSFNGLSLYEIDDNNLRHLNNSTGLSYAAISEFHVTNNTLYISNSSTLQYISLNKLLNKPSAIPIRLSSIRVNDLPISSTSLSADQRKIEFNFQVSTLRYRDNLQYCYKLEGYDSDWQELDYINNKAVYNALAAGEYTFLLKSVNGSSSSEIIRYPFSIDAPFHQKWWFFVLLFLTSGAVIGSIFLYRIKKIRTKNKERLEKQKIQTDLLESELKALRSQMNPHFIFNSLNSIQDLILKEETDASYDYIVLFADLVRNTLNYSNKDFIPIDKELEFLDVYLSLEKLRFKEDFEYSIKSNDITDVKVPSLLVQPFIENALIHGLIHKEGVKRLLITFELKEEKLTCIIRDNGIGRTRAKEIQNRQGNHDSFALKAIEKRLSILNEQNDQQSSFVINDLMENGIVAGTEVILTLPFRHLY